MPGAVNTGRGGSMCAWTRTLVPSRRVLGGTHLRALLLWFSGWGGAACISEQTEPSRRHERTELPRWPLDATEPPPCIPLLSDAPLGLLKLTCFTQNGSSWLPGNGPRARALPGGGGRGTTVSGPAGAICPFVTRPGAARTHHVAHGSLPGSGLGFRGEGQIVGAEPESGTPGGAATRLFLPEPSLQQGSEALSLSASVLPWTLTQGFTPCTEARGQDTRVYSSVLPSGRGQHAVPDEPTSAAPGGLGGTRFTGGSGRPGGGDTRTHVPRLFDAFSSCKHVGAHRGCRRD